MSKDKLRISTKCLNCDHSVKERYCPNCGQENTASRKTFHHLFINFFEDLTHYDNSFWRTIFYLFFKPAALTTAYMSGKRFSYLAPIRLYIFISFVTFLTISLFPAETLNKRDLLTVQENNKELVIPTIDSLHIEEKSVNGLTKVGILSQKNNDTIIKILQQTTEIDTGKTDHKEVADFGYKSVKELDSIQKHGDKEIKVSTTEYWFLKKWLAVKEENSNEQIVEKFMYSFTSNIPKVLFLYMPVFAFTLWLFHDKKKWYYFDHGIFTLHYFSFLLLLILTLFFVDKLMLLFDPTPVVEWISFSIKLIGFFWMIYYFFRAHRRYYQHAFLKSFYKSSLIILINSITLFILVVAFALYTFNEIH